MRLVAMIVVREEMDQSRTAPDFGTVDRHNDLDADRGSRSFPSHGFGLSTAE